jgi:hypothetical protein
MVTLKECGEKMEWFSNAEEETYRLFSLYLRENVNTKVTFVTKPVVCIQGVNVEILEIEKSNNNLLWIITKEGRYKVALLEINDIYKLIINLKS